MNVRDFQLVRAPESFLDDPYPWYAALREQDPVHALEGGGVFLSRYDDALAVYRDSRASSDKKIEFAPKFGASPLYEHHTTSLVFNDPPLHTRVRRLIMGALNQRAIARMEADVVKLVDGLLDEMERKSEVDLVEDFAARIPVEVIGNLLDIPKARARPAARLVDRHPLGAGAEADAGDAGNAAIAPSRTSSTSSKDLMRKDAKSPGDYESDVLTRLIQGEQDGEKLTAPELHHNCIFLLNAGHETTTNLIGNGLWLLLESLGRIGKIA